MDTKPNVVLFCGGSGAATISVALQPHCNLTLVVNCYDDDLSTGALRRLIPGMLGPSDIRKNVARFSPYGYFLDRRVSTGMLRYAADELCRGITIPGVESTLKHFIDEVVDEDIPDCCVGNLLFAAYYLQADRDFNAAATKFCKDALCQVRVLNATRGENRTLRAITDHASFSIVPDEASICGGRFEGTIKKVWLDHAEPLPKLNPEVADAIGKAALILYGPGTQHSSLLPSYLTTGLMDAIQIRRVPKVFIPNVARDKDIPTETVRDLIDKAFDCFFQYQPRPEFPEGLITYLMLDRKHTSIPLGDIDMPGIAQISGSFTDGKRHNGRVMVPYLLSLAGMKLSY